MDGQMEARKREPADMQTEKVEKRFEHLRLSTVPSTILFYENYKKKNYETLVKKTFPNHNGIFKILSEEILDTCYLKTENEDIFYP